MKPRLLLFYPAMSSFIRKDVAILDSLYEVSSYDFAATSKAQTPLALLRQLGYLLVHIWRAEVVVCEFAAYHSLLPVLLARIAGLPAIVIIGGNDGHYFPQIGYGNYTKGLLGFFTRATLACCTHIVPKHQSLIYTDYYYDRDSPKVQGVRAVMPGLKTPYTPIENGYDAGQWYCDTPKIPQSFITVCGGLEYPFQYVLKGIDLFVTAARNVPEGIFTIVGVPVGYVIAHCPPNLHLLPATPNHQLRAIYSTQRYYVQLSMAEGFPNALCEAMLCECVPIGSAVFSIPEIIGDSGFILEHREEQLLMPLIATALTADLDMLGKRARTRIATHYTEAMRRERLLGLIGGILKKRKPKS